MKQDKGLEKLGDLFGQDSKSQRSRPPAPAYAWQDLALHVIKELNIPGFKRSAVFKVCKQRPRVFIEKCLNDTKELCQTGEKWKYFFKVAAGGTGNKKL
jgi:hypothetical protein